MTSYTAQATATFIEACSFLEEDGDGRIARLYPLVRGLVLAAYGAKMGMRRHLDDLAADGAVGLVEGVRAGLVGTELASAILEHVECSRMKSGPMPMAPDDVARRASALPTAEEVMVARETGVEPIRHIAPRPRDLRPAIARLPERDRKLVHAYYHQRKSVRAIGAELGISGMAVSYRLRRIRDRIRVLVELPELTPDGIRRDLEGVVNPQRIEGYDPVRALTVYYQTMSQSETAEQLGVAQERVSYTVTQAVSRLATVHRLAKYHKAFALIQRHGLMWSRR